MTYVIGGQFRPDFSKIYSGQIYHYVVPDEIELKVGDIAIVDTQYGPGLVKVHSLHSESAKATRYVIQKVDLSEHQERQERMRRRSVIQSKLRAIEKEVFDRQKYDMLRMYSPEAAELLRELETL